MRTGGLADTEVVVGLVNNGSAAAVAAAGVAEAVRRGSPIRFVVVTASGAGPDERSAVGDTAFQSALRALHGHSRTRCIFEEVSGDPAKVLVERSRRASVLVVGADAVAAGGDPDAAAVAAYCRDHAACSVIEVSSAGGELREPVRHASGA